VQSVGHVLIHDRFLASVFQGFDGFS